MRVCDLYTLCCAYVAKTRRREWGHAEPRGSVQADLCDSE